MRGSRHRQGKGTLGQATNEIIIALVLVALTAILIVGVFGREVADRYLCVARSFFTGESCTGKSAAGGNGSPGRPGDGPGRGGPSGGGSGGPAPSGGGPRSGGPDGAGPGGGSPDDASSGEGAPSDDDRGLPAPGDPPTGQAAGSQPPLGDAEDRQDQARDILGRTERGRAVLDFLDKNGISIILGPTGRGTVFNPNRNVIFLDSGLTAERMASAIVHEKHHAQEALAGRTANSDAAIAAIRRSDYVDRMINEESRAVTAEIRMRFELERAGVTFPPPTDQERAFLDAYAAALRGKTDPTSRDLQKAENVLFNLVRRDFDDGTYRPSNSPNETYPELYGRYYDEARARLGLPPNP